MKIIFYVELIFVTHKNIPENY